MATTDGEQCQKLLTALRKIIQAIDRHSINLEKRYGLTGPQLIILQSIATNDQISVTKLSKKVSLSQATVTDITKRLEKKGYIIRKKSLCDKRKTNITLMEKGQKILNRVPPPFQEQFIDQFSKLATWEQLMIESSFERVASMMPTGNIEAIQ